MAMEVYQAKSWASLVQAPVNSKRLWEAMHFQFFTHKHSERCRSELSSLLGVSPVVSLFIMYTIFSLFYFVLGRRSVSSVI